MRIISGSAKGFRLQVPQRSGLRPTTDLVRGAIFSMLESATADWSRVLDLYAGTGALGMEALSRGAGWADFVEQDARLCAIMKENLGRAGFSGQAHIYCASVKRALTFLTDSYSIVFMDPPYMVPNLDGLTQAVASSRVVGGGGIVVVAHSARRPLSPAYGGLPLLKERRHGDTMISLYHKEGEV